jgi:hypothetical protein
MDKLKSHNCTMHYMNEAITSIGILVFLLGLWYDFGTYIYAFVEPKAIPATWNDLILPVTLTSAGIALTLFGIKTDVRLRTRVTRSRQHA